jgi:pimeloyl-ACP methyl ester carboxylesterase
VLLCPGAATSRLLGLDASALDKRGVRLISVDRPGLGSSTPAPGRELNDWAADIQSWAATRKLEGLLAVGFSSGAPFALACAARGVVKGAAIVAGTDELAHPALRGKLHPEVARLVALAATEPARAEAFFAGLSAQAMWDMIIRMSSEADRAVYTETRFAETYQRALARGSGDLLAARAIRLSAGQAALRELARLSTPPPCRT